MRPCPALLAEPKFDTRLPINPEQPISLPLCFLQSSFLSNLNTV
jgi:hypothetical protein